LTADGPGSTVIEVGDMTVIGDLAIRSLGSDGQIRLLGRQASAVDTPGNEGDRTNPAQADTGAELIAAGMILLDGQLSTDATGIALGARQVIIANETGLGQTLGLPIEIIEGGAGLDRFRGVLASTDGLLYAYDLAAFAAAPESTANLAEAFNGDLGVPLRNDERLLADAAVLNALGFTPDAAVSPGAATGSGSIVQISAVLSDDRWSVTTDRFSLRALGRLTLAYTDLFGDPLSEPAAQRGEFQRVQREVASLWADWTSAGRPDDTLAFAASTDEKRAESLARLGRVLLAIDLLELTPAERDHARLTLLSRLSPDGVAPEELGGAWFPRTPGSVAVRAR
jgi:hypothetical protein